MAFEIENGILKKYIPEDGETEIVIPEGVTEIGKMAVCDCPKLESVIFPESLLEIGERAFWLCKGLKQAVLPPHLTTIGLMAFERCESLTEMSIPDSVTAIGTEAFGKCTGLRRVRLPAGLTKIASHLFYDCENLADITIPESVTNIGMWAFFGCKKLVGLRIPDGVTKVGDGAFSNCPSIRMFHITFAPDRYAKQVSEVIEKLHKRDFSEKPDTNMKCAAVLGYWLETGDEDAGNCIAQAMDAVMAFLIRNENADVMQRILDAERFVTADNIDSCIALAIEHTQNGGSPEMQTMLMHHKSDVLGYRNPLEQFQL